MDPNHWQNVVNHLQKSQYCNRVLSKEDFEWLFDVPNCSELMSWFCGYVTTDNVLTEQEYFEWYRMALDQVDIHLTSEQNDDQQVELLTEDDITALEEEMSGLDFYIATLENLNDNLSVEINQASEELAHLNEEETKEAHENEKKAELACIQLSYQLDNSQMEFHKLILKLRSIINNNGDMKHQPELISQMPFTDLLEQYEKFNKLISAVRPQNGLEKATHLEETKTGTESGDQFKSAHNIECWWNPNSVSNKSSLEKMLKKLDILKENLTQATTDYTFALLEKAESSAVLAYLAKLKADITSGVYHRHTRPLQHIRIIDLEDKMKKSYGVSLVNDVECASADLTNALLKKVLFGIRTYLKFQQCVVSTRRYVLTQCINAEVHHMYLVLYLIAQEHQNIQETVQLCQSYLGPLHEELTNVSDRREKMTIIRVAHDSRSGSDLCAFNSLPKLMSFIVPTKTPYTKLFDVWNRFNRRVDELEMKVFHTSPRDRLISLTTSVQMIRHLRKTLSGPTKKPVMVNQEISRQLYDLRQSAICLEDTFNKYKFETEEITTYNTKNQFKDKRFLWVYFVTDRKKIDKLIYNMEQFLNNND